ncbi:MAG: alanyl-tRNA editing protein [Bacillota bacterium]
MNSFIFYVYYKVGINVKKESGVFMTIKLYYQDPYITSFSTKLIKKELDDSGRYYVVLEETAFYPTGGGQPNDRGTLNGIKVNDVEEVEGEIRHYVEHLPSEHQVIDGEINWDRRFDHMQQHTGQHILSAAFEETYGYKTISFHLGKEICTIDLEIQDLNEEEANHAEYIANKIVLDNRPIITKWITEAEQSHYKLRKQLAVTDNIRLVIIPDFDYNGCGGTHPRSTSGVGSIKILNWEKQKKNIRVYFVCGQRVIEQLHEKQKVLLDLTSTLNAPQQQMSEAVNRLLVNTNILEKEVQELKSQLVHYEAKDLIAKADLVNNYKVIRSVFKNRSINEVQSLARAIVSRETNVIVFLIGDHVDKLQLVCARSDELHINMNKMLRAVLPSINGKGGGKDSFALGGGERTISPEDLIDDLVQKISLEDK